MTTEEARPTTGPKPRWYVIKAINGRESQALQSIKIQIRINHLEDYIEEFLIPVERVAQVRRGKKVTTEKKLYPGYIYAHLQATTDVLEVIRNVDGVTGFLGSDPRRPDPLSTEEAEQIIKIAAAQDQDEQRAVIIQIPYNVGDKVKVKEGTFAGMDGTIEEINKQKGTLRVLITVFGRQTPVELEVWQVEEIA